MGGDLPMTACAVCGQILSAARSPLGVVDWVHSRTSVDHVTVPVPADQIVANVRCDFCLADDAAWLLPVEPFEVAGGYSSDADWALCDMCRDHIVCDEWEQVVERAAAAVESAASASGREALRAMYAQVREHMTGAPVPRR